MSRSRSLTQQAVRCLAAVSLAAVSLGATVSCADVSLLNDAGMPAAESSLLQPGVTPATAAAPASPASLIEPAASAAVPPGAAAGEAINGGDSINLTVTGRGGVPESGVGAVALNVTVTEPSQASYLTVWPTGEPRPQSSNLNFVAGQTVPNMVIAKVGANGQVSLFNYAGFTEVIVDVFGWFPTGQSFTPVSPARLMDTRPGYATVDAASAGGGALGASVSRNVTVTGRGNVPSTGVGAVAVNLTAIAPTANSYLTAWPAGVARPATSNVNVRAGSTVPNLVLASVGANGQLSVFNYAGSTHVAVDVLAWFPTSGSFFGLTPARLMDTRAGMNTTDGQYLGGGRIGAGGSLDLQVTGRGNVPGSGVGAVALNITVDNPSAAAFLTAWPTGVTRPGVSNINDERGRSIANMAIVKVGAGGRISLFNSAGTTDVIVDVLGWFPAGQGFTGLTPTRLLDTREEDEPSQPAEPGPLPAIAPGTWQQIDPPLDLNKFGADQFGFQTIGLSASNPKIVYVGTCYEGIWKTTNAGNTWAKVSVGSNGANLATGRNWSLAVDPTNANVVYTVAGYGNGQGLWRSTDGGVNWKQMLPASVIAATTADIYSIAIDPADHKHLLLGSHSNWGSASSGVLESKDSGLTWIIHPGQPSWGHGHYVFFIDSSTWLIGTQDDGFWRTTNSGGSWVKVSDEDLQHGGGQLYRASNGALYTGAVGTLLRSTNNGVSWTRVGPTTSDGYNGIIGDGTTMYAQRANTGFASTGPAPYVTSPETDGTTWTPFNGGAQLFSDGPINMVFDPVNRIIYSSNWRAGVWRLKL